MKNNIFGYLFLIFIIIIMGFAFYKVRTNNVNQNNKDGGNSSVVVSKQKGTKMTLGISDLDSINPIITRNKNVQNITKLIYEPLFEVTEDGRVEECLAKEWATTDSRTYIIKLKSGIKWTDGSFFSSNDVKYTLDRLKKTNKSIYADNVKYVSEVDIIDNTTLRIILSKEVPFFEYYLNFPILSSNYFGDEDFWETKKNKAPSTTGRFKISEVTEKTIVLTKNEDWWNKEKNDSIIETINLNKYSSVAELYNAFKLGRIDLIATENVNYKEYIGTIGYNVSEIDGRQFIFLALNTENNYLSDKNVRKAIRATINKSNIVSSVYGKMYTVSNFPLSKNSYLVKLGEENYYRKEEVKTYLSTAGWAFRGGVWQKIVDYKAIRLELNLVVNAKDSKRVKVADYIKRSLNEQGIIVNIIQASNKDYKKYLEEKNYDMILCESTMSITPDLTTYFGDSNLANFKNNEINEIMSYINNITDKEELKKRYQRLYDIYNDEVPYIGIARNKIAVITNSYLSGEIRARWYNLFFGFNDWYTS